MTKQIKDIIKFEGIEYLLEEHLLESYFENYPEKKLKGELETCMWRGYFSDYEIKKDQLFITTLKVSKKGKFKSVLDENFPNSKKMNWFTGLILINYSNKRGAIQYRNYDLSTEEKYSILQIEKGQLTETRDFNLEKLNLFKKEQTEYFKLGMEYELLKEKYISKQNYNYAKANLSKKELKRFYFNQNEFDEYVEMFIIQKSKYFLAD